MNEFICTDCRASFPTVGKLIAHELKAGHESKVVVENGKQIIVGREYITEDVPVPPPGGWSE